tara:strand:- start:757 stop:1197 length:441 start_codon:yes stop_codon:yes gene_type:complete
MINLEFDNFFHQITIIIIVIFLLYIGWKLRRAYKNFLFFLLKKRGRKGEIYAKKLLKRNGYKILSTQHKMQGYLYENGERVSYEVRPDYLVSKDDIKYIAEVKTGLAALINDRHTRRQLLEYSKIFNSNKVLLVDITRNRIKIIEY